MFFAVRHPALGCSSYYLESSWGPWHSSKGLTFWIHVLVTMFRLYATRSPRPPARPHLARPLASPVGYHRVSM